MVSDIPVIEMYVENPVRKLPMVIIVHGFTDSKEQILSHTYYFAKEGYFTVAFDACNHGEPETKQFGQFSYYEKGSHLFEIINKSSKCIDRMIEDYGGNHQADNDRIALIGFSMGGMIVYDYVLKSKSLKIKTAISIIATAVWGNPLRRDIAQYPDFAKYFDERKIVEIEGQQPSNFIENMKDFPLLMLNAELDEKMPIENVRWVYNEIRKRYTNKDLIKFVEYKGIGHTTTPQMLSEATKWIKKYV